MLSYVGEQNWTESSKDVRVGQCSEEMNTLKLYTGASQSNDMRQVKL